MGVRTRGLDIKAGAMRTATEKAARAEAEGVVQRWNEQLALGRDMLWSPTIGAALLAGTPWLSKGAGFLFSIRSRRAATTIPGAERIKTSVGRFLDAVLIFLVPALLPGENMFPIFLMPPFIKGKALIAVFLAVAFIIGMTVLSVFIPPPLVIGATLLPVLFVPAFFGSAISLPLLGC
jgi:hypothetical protein